MQGTNMDYTEFWFPLQPNDITEEKNLKPEKRTELLNSLMEFQDCKPERVAVAEAYDQNEEKSFYAVASIYAGCEERFVNFLVEKQIPYFLRNSFTMDLIPANEEELNIALNESEKNLSNYYRGDSSGCVLF